MKESSLWRKDGPFATKTSLADKKFAEPTSESGRC